MVVAIFFENRQFLLSICRRKVVECEVSLKKISLIILFLLIISGCSKKTADFDMEAFAADMLTSGAFSDELTAADSDIGCYLYAIEEADAEAMMFYFSSGATAEEMVIFKAMMKMEPPIWRMLSEPVRNIRSPPLSLCAHRAAQA
jgi:replication initiation and membrane attachment protein DnaB